jgi:hypothetical protein
VEIRDVEDGGHGIHLDIGVRSGREDEIREMRRDVRGQRR